MEAFPRVDELKHQLEDYVSAPKVGERDDEYFAAVHRASAVPRRADLKLWETGDART